MGGTGSGRPPRPSEIKRKAEREAAKKPAGTVVSPGVEEVTPPTAEEKAAHIADELKKIQETEGSGEDKPRRRKYSPRKSRSFDDDDESEMKRKEIDSLKEATLPAVDLLLDLGVSYIPNAKPAKQVEKDIVSFGAGLAIEQNFDKFKEMSWKVFLFGGLAAVFVPRLFIYLKEVNEKKAASDTDIREDGQRKKLPDEAAPIAV